MEAFGVKFDEVVLILSENGDKSVIEGVEHCANKTVVGRDELLGLEASENDAVFVQLPEKQITDTLLQQLLKFLRPGGKLVINTATKDHDDIKFSLQTSGYTQIEIQNTSICALRPSYEIGSSAKLNLKKPAVAVWKLDEDLDEEETIDPDNLLDDDDFKKPDLGSLKVCGTTGKRKACRDCSCGLAEELAGEVKSGKTIDTTDAPKSSCGSCYLGDAFRCASCPYLGMPAFKPGEKIQLGGNLLKADI